MQGLRSTATDSLIPVPFSKTVMLCQFVLEVHGGIQILMLEFITKQMPRTQGDLPFFV